MVKRIFLTGATDGIGKETVKMLASLGHSVLLHGRNATKLDEIEQSLGSLYEDAHIESYVADLSRMTDVKALAKTVTEKHDNLDVLINNAGIFKAPDPITQDGLDIRFVVNTFAPYLLTKYLFPLLGTSGRVINLSSAAQSPVDPKALAGRIKLSDFEAYAQSELALTMWSCRMGFSLKDKGPAIIAVNPGSMLGSKMVKEAFGVAGGDIRVGADILCRAALNDEFAGASGQYFDNDSGRFVSPHPDALDLKKSEGIVRLIETTIDNI